MTEEYQSYLRSKEWSRKRHQRLELSKHKCSACGTKWALHVHHLTYDRIFNEDMADLLPLCEPHHELAEKFVRLGMLPRNENVLFLATETVRLVLTADPSKIETGKEKKRRTSKEIQAQLLQEPWFIEAMKLDRKQFKKLFKKSSKGRPNHGRWCANGFTLYDRQHKPNNQTKKDQNQ